MWVFLVSVALLAALVPANSQTLPGSCVAKCATAPGPINYPWVPPPPPPMLGPSPPMVPPPSFLLQSPVAYTNFMAAPSSFLAPAGPPAVGTDMYTSPSFPNSLGLGFWSSNSMQSSSPGAFLGSMYNTASYRQFGYLPYQAGPMSPFNAYPPWYGQSWYGPGYGAPYSPYPGYGAPPPAQCSCDTACVSRGQCCFDYSSVCAAPAPSTPTIAPGSSNNVDTILANVTQLLQTVANTQQTLSAILLGLLPGTGPTPTPGTPTPIPTPGTPTPIPTPVTQSPTSPTGVQTPTNSPTTNAPTITGHRLFYPGTNGGNDTLGTLYSVDVSDLSNPHATVVMTGTPYQTFDEDYRTNGFVCCDLKGRMIGILNTAGASFTWKIVAVDPKKPKQLEVIYTGDEFSLHNGHWIERPQNGGLMVNSNKGYLGATAWGGKDNLGVVYYFDLDPSSNTYLEFFVVYEFQKDPDPTSNKQDEVGLEVAGPPQQGPGNQVLFMVRGREVGNRRPTSSILFTHYTDVFPKLVLLEPSDATDFRKTWNKLQSRNVDQESALMGAGMNTPYITDSWYYVEGYDKMTMSRIKGDLTGTIDDYYPYNQFCGFPLGFFKMGVANKKTIVCEAPQAGEGPTAVGFATQQLSSEVVVKVFTGMTNAIVQPQFGVDSQQIGMLYLQAGTRRGAQYFDMLNDQRLKGTSIDYAARDTYASQVVQLSSGYSSKTLLVGTTTPNSHGMIFVGCPGVGINDGISDRYLVQRAHDGGIKNRGTIITLDRQTDTFEYLSLGVQPKGAYPWGKNFLIDDKVCGWMDRGGGAKVQETSRTQEARGKRLSLYCYDDKTDSYTNYKDLYYPSSYDVNIDTAPVHGVVWFSAMVVGATRRLSCNTVKNTCEVYYDIVRLDLQYGSSADYRASHSRMHKQRYGSAIPIMESTKRDSSGQLLPQGYIATDEGLLCYDGANKHFFDSAAFDYLKELPIKGVTYHASTDKLYLPVKYGTGTHSSIWSFEADCSLPKVSASYLANTTSAISTKMLSAKDNKLYLGTKDGKLMKFDPTTNALTQLHDFSTVNLISIIKSSSSDVELLGELTEMNLGAGTNAMLYGFIGVKSDDLLHRNNKFFVYGYDLVTNTATVEVWADSYALIGNPHPGLLLRNCHNCP